MLRRIFSSSFLVLSGAALSAQPDARTTILAMERAALGRSDRGDVEGFLQISAPEVTYFDPMIERSIQGRDALRAYYQKIPASKNPARGEMSNENVQVHGDFAVLTFNYASKGEHVIHWNATEVYRRGADGWRIIHTHWSLRKPELKQPGL
jgi:ketosteroid isomerase-like protein